MEYLSNSTTAKALTPSTLKHMLAMSAPYSSIFIWGQPGVGKSYIVEEYAKSLNLDCVTLLGSQLAAEDIIGIPQIMDGTYRHCPPRQIARHEPYCLFLDEFNASSPEVQKVFYTIIHERLIGEYRLPPGSLVIAAGNRACDNTHINTLASALVNRMLHLQVEPSTNDWVNWAKGEGLHPLVISYIEKNPGDLCRQAPQDERPFSTPRSWHMLSNILSGIFDECSDQDLRTICVGILSEEHVVPFIEFSQKNLDRYYINHFISSEDGWTADNAEDLMFYSKSLSVYLAKILPEHMEDLSEERLAIVQKSIQAVQKLEKINDMLTTKFFKENRGDLLPAWFLTETFLENEKPKRLFGQ